MLRALAVAREAHQAWKASTDDAGTDAARKAVAALGKLRSQLAAGGIDAAAAGYLLGWARGAFSVMTYGPSAGSGSRRPTQS